VDEAWIHGLQRNDLVEKELRDYKWDPVNNVENDDDQKDFGNMTASLRDAFYRLTTMKNFEDFATKRLFPNEEGPKEKGYGFASAENLHDNMHGWCGGPAAVIDKDNNCRLLGHMSHVPLAAFDPIFWLHHW
jgi:tyrosinase